MHTFTPVPLPRILLLWFSENRGQFNHAVETSRDWVMLGLQAGEFRYALGEGETGMCHAGDFVLCPPGVPLARAVVKTIDFYTIRFRWKPPAPALWRGKWTLRDGARLDSTLACLRLCRDSPDPRTRSAWANHLLADILHQLAYEIQKSASARATPDSLMLRAEMQLRRDLSYDAPLQDIAEMLRISPFQLSRRFRAAFGVSPSLYRTRLRIQQARRLLMETDWTTDRIAGACGFDNAFYFSRVFTRQTGQAPRDFRREHRV